MFPKIVAVATDPHITPIKIVFDPPNIGGFALKFGQDITSELNRPAPARQSVGKTEAELKPKMKKLLDIFAAGDNSGMAKRLVEKFLAKQTDIQFFQDPDLNNAAARHAHIQSFCNLALNAPNLPEYGPGKMRIHQVLQRAGWDIEKIDPPSDLGVPAFNMGTKALRNQDWNNGLGLMIDGVQHVIVLASDYKYNGAGTENNGQKADTYKITLRYIFYDVFGLDDTDLASFGATSDGFLAIPAEVGITAWWQLQHQFNYKPLVTRIIIDKIFEVSTK